MDERPDPAKIERGLSEGQRFALAASRDGKVAADVGTGHTNAALRRRGLLTRDLVWDHGSWWLRLTELGCEVAQLAKQSTRVGGGRGKRGPRPWPTSPSSEAAMPDPKPMLYQDYCEALAAWLRSLADAVERADVEPTDVAQALFAADTYTVGCPLSEAQSETGDDLNEASKVFYPAPILTGAKEPGDARWRPTKTLAERVELIITLCDALKREAVTGADPGYRAGIRYAAQSILDALPKHSVSDGVLP